MFSANMDKGGSISVRLLVRRRASPKSIRRTSACSRGGRGEKTDADDELDEEEQSPDGDEDLRRRGRNAQIML